MFALNLYTLKTEVLAHSKYELIFWKKNSKLLLWSGQYRNLVFYQTEFFCGSHHLFFFLFYRFFFRNELKDIGERINN